LPVASPARFICSPTSGTSEQPERAAINTRANHVDRRTTRRECEVGKPPEPVGFGSHDGDMTAMYMFRIRAIPAAEIDAVRSSGRDVSGTAVETFAAAGGEPLRCCLRDARPGEQCLLFGYEPTLPGPAGPYREVGAVFAHTDRCTGPERTDAYPDDWRGRQQVLRAYDHRGWIHPATTTHDGSDPAAALRDVLAQPGVAEVHSRNVAYGCYMFAATRA
jgi:hypothetical protein